MLISRNSAPIRWASASAFERVREVVPKQGIVTASSARSGSPASFSARAVAIRASVESSPPDTPSTARFAPVCLSRFASACAWIDSISSARSDRCSGSSGTNGAGSIYRRSSSLRSSVENGTSKCSSALSRKPFAARRSPARNRTSTSP